MSDNNQDIIKDFEGWSTLKQQLDRRENPRTFKEREIWWCSVGMNIGYEIFGKSHIFTRPVLVIRKFSRYTFLGAPLTSKCDDRKNRYRIHIGGNENNVILDQVRCFDGRRLINRLGYLSDDQFEAVKDFYRSMI